MIKGYSHKPMGTVALGTHLGNLIFQKKIL